MQKQNYYKRHPSETKTAIQGFCEILVKVCNMPDSGWENDAYNYYRLMDQVKNLFETAYIKNGEINCAAIKNSVGVVND